MLQPSLPSWERGLKCHKAKKINFCLSSLPSWERGLKLPFLPDVPQLHLVAPLVGAWIEIEKDKEAAEFVESLPSWERGLK